MPTASKKAKQRTPRNRTIELDSGEIERLRSSLMFAENNPDVSEARNAVICGNAFDVLNRLPSARFDLLFADPPYNLTKDFGTETFAQRSSDAYEEWLDSWLKLCVRLLTPTASVIFVATGAQVQRSSASVRDISNYKTASPGNARKAAVQRRIGKTQPKISGFLPFPMNSRSISTR